VLKQLQYVPMPVEEQVLILYAVTNGHLDSVAIPQVSRWESEFLRFMRTTHAEVGTKIADSKQLDEATESALKAALEGFKRQFAG
jgi:F-type H+-transporting ATPase subunit alpha